MSGEPPMLPLPPALAHCVPGNPQRFASAPVSIAWGHRTKCTAAVRAQSSSAAHQWAGLIRVQSSAVHGTGVFACRDIARGELVLEERPLVCCETLRAASGADPDIDRGYSSSVQKHQRTDAASELWQQWADQLVAFVRLDWISRGILLSLWSPPVGSAEAGDLNLQGFISWLAEQRPALLRVLPAAICARVIMIFWCSAFEWGQHHHAILPLATRINHSCTPNVVHDSGDQRVTSSHYRRSVRFYAVQDIGANTELFHDYLGLQFWDGRFRRERLAATKLFTCRCQLCSGSNSAQQARSDDEESAIAISENLRSQLGREAAGRSVDFAEQASAQRALIEALVGSEHWAAQQASLCLIRVVAAACCTGEQSSALVKSLAEDLGTEVGSLWHWLEHSRKVTLSPVWYIGVSTLLTVAHVLQQQLSQTREAIALLKKALAAMSRESSQYKELALALVVVQAAGRAKEAP